MPYRYYHGRTGKVFHVVNRAVGVLVNKRVKANQEQAKEAKKSGKKEQLKRKPREPKP